MICTKCRNEIPRGAKYVSFTRATESVGRLGAVKVSDAELLETYHPECAPPSQNHASR